MNELTAEEKAIIEQYRNLTDYGRIEIVKQGGFLFEMVVTEKKRYIRPMERPKAMAIPAKI